MAHRFNLTKRARINLDQFKIKVLPDTKPLTIEIERNFDSFGDRFGQDDQLVVEAHRRQKAQRVVVGLLKDLPATFPVSFGDFSDGAGVLFRAKVVSSGTRSIKGLVRKIRPVGPKPKQSTVDTILAVNLADPEDNIGERFWKLSFSQGSEMPTLLLSPKHFPSSDAAAAPIFRALVLPEAVREVLIEAFLVHSTNQPGWAKKWRKFVELILGEPWPCESEGPDSLDDLPQYVEDVSGWIERATCAVADRFDIKRVTIKDLTKEVEDV